MLIGAAASGKNARIYEASILKTLGATRAEILASFALRSGLLGLCAGTVALIAGTTGGYLVRTRILDTNFTVVWPSALAIVVGGVLATMIAGLFFAWSALKSNPSRMLRARE